MGGRGSAGGRGGGGASKTQPEVSDKKFNDYIKEKFDNFEDARKRYKEIN